MNLLEDVKRHMDEMRGFITETQCFPFYNVSKEVDGSTIVELALAGFKREDLTVEKDRYKIYIRSVAKDEARSYLVKGISTKPFSIAIPRYNRELKEVSFLDGILKIKLVDTKHTTESVEVK